MKPAKREEVEELCKQGALKQLLVLASETSSYSFLTSASAWHSELNCGCTNACVIFRFFTKFDKKSFAAPITEKRY